MKQTNRQARGVALTITSLVAGNGVCPVAIMVEVGRNHSETCCDTAANLALYQRIRWVGMFTSNRLALNLPMNGGYHDICNERST